MRIVKSDISWTIHARTRTRRQRLAVRLLRCAFLVCCLVAGRYDP